MRYLFLDMEFANSFDNKSKICEFGYVIVDEAFNVLEKRNILVNPKVTKWDYYVVKKLLTFSKKEYISASAFDLIYKEIKSIIESADYVFGHSTVSDIKALNDECRRYDLPFLNFSFYDIKLIYAEYQTNSKKLGLSNILYGLSQKENTNRHNALEDAISTMIVMKDMLESMEISLEDFLELCPKGLDKTENGVIASILEEKSYLKKKLEPTLDGDESNLLIKHSLNWERFLQFLDNVKATEEHITPNLYNKKICISMNYEELHYKQMLNLVQIIKNAGGSYVLKASDADIFVQYDIKLENGSVRKCSRLDYVKKTLNEGKFIQIVMLDEFLRLLGIKENDLNELPRPSFLFLYEKKSKIRNKKIKRLQEI